MAWSDIFRLFNYSFENDPITKRQRHQQITGAGVTQPDAMPDLRQDSAFSGGGQLQLRDTNEMVDISAVQGRQSRYKEYERLRTVPEIEMAMTVMADETCLSGDTKVATLFDGLVSIQWLAENKREPFLVYAWDFEQNDYTLAWAFEPRVVRKSKTIKIILDDGTHFVATPEHRVLLKDGGWTETSNLKFGNELMPFYRLRPNRDLNELKTEQFPRIFTFSDGWKHERQFINEWKNGRKDKELEKINQACRMLAQGLSVRETSKLMKHQWNTIESWINKAGFTTRELKHLGKKADRRRVVGVVANGPEIDVYDLSVQKHQNFCGESVIFHNCQKGENGHLFEINVKDKEIKEELDFLFFNRKMLNMDRKLWKASKKTYIKGDEFWELVIDPENPKSGVLKIQELPPESMFRIETTKGKLVEFQQSKDGPDYEAVARTPVAQSTDAELAAGRAIRFNPNQIIHIKINDDRQDFHPYGVSLIEPARGPAHSLRLMEDAMLVYRLTRAPERRVFYIDVGQLPPYKAEAFIDRIKDQFRKKKVPRPTGQGASAVEEKWHAPAADEDYWLPIRPNANTRIETLPGAQNLGEIDDAKYFRDKLFIALNFPKNYFSTEDAQVTRIALSAQDVKFARMIERLQQSLEDGIWHVADRHLKLRGYPEESYEDLTIKLTPPSDWREMSRAEVVTNRINNAGSVKGSLLYDDLTILVDILKIPEDKANAIISRLKMQKLDDLKLQVLAANPALMGVGVPTEADGKEVGAEAGGPNPMLSPDDQQPPSPDNGQNQGTPPPAANDNGGEAPATTPTAALPEPSDTDIKKYDLQVQTYSSEQDREEIDYSA